jgi:hypothetical protein
MRWLRQPFYRAVHPSSPHQLFGFYAAVFKVLPSCEVLQSVGRSRPLTDFVLPIEIGGSTQVSLTDTIRYFF